MDSVLSFLLFYSSLASLIFSNLTDFLCLVILLTLLGDSSTITFLFTMGEKQFISPEYFLFWNLSLLAYFYLTESLNCLCQIWLPPFIVIFNSPSFISMWFSIYWVFKLLGFGVCTIWRLFFEVTEAYRWVALLIKSMSFLGGSAWRIVALLLQIEGDGGSLIWDGSTPTLFLRSSFCRSAVRLENIRFICLMQDSRSSRCFMGTHRKLISRQYLRSCFLSNPRFSLTNQVSILFSQRQADRKTSLNFMFSKELTSKLPRRELTAKGTYSQSRWKRPYYSRTFSSLMTLGLEIFLATSNFSFSA